MDAHRRIYYSRVYYGMIGDRILVKIPQPTIFCKIARQKLPNLSKMTLCLKALTWRGGRAVECGSLENYFRVIPDGGSNPPLSVCVCTFNN